VASPKKNKKQKKTSSSLPQDAVSPVKIKAKYLLKKNDSI
jgi:hypothetical protein